MLFDTPGFDDTYRLDADILAELAETFTALYKNKLQLAGIIYVHRITDNRMTNTLLRNLSVIRNICGDDPLKNVVILTTFWDKEDAQLAKNREKEMREKADWWGYMLSRGAKSRRFFNTEESAHKILAEFIDKDRVTLQIQTEMVEQGLNIRDTQAGSQLNLEITQLTEKHREELLALERRMDEARRLDDIRLQELLAIERREKEKELTRMQREQMAMDRDRSEEMRRMEQMFEDQLRRLVDERRERDAQILELEKQLSQERKETRDSIKTALQDSNANLEQIYQRFRNERAEDKARYEEEIRKYKRERDIAMKEHEEREKRTNEEIMRIFEEKQNASDDEKRRLESQLQDLEAKKKRSKTDLWSKIGGVALCAILAPLTGGLSTLVMPLFGGDGGA